MDFLQQQGIEVKVIPGTKISETMSLLSIFFSPIIER